MQNEQQKRPDKIEAEKLIGQVIHRHKGSFNDRDSIIYSLAIGFSQDPLKIEDFKYTSQIDQQFMAFPTSAGVSHKGIFIKPLLESKNMPVFSRYQILHGEQIITFIKDKLQVGVQYYHQSKIIDVIDKGKNAIVWYQVNSYIENQGKKQLAYICHHSLFIKGLGGFGYKGKNIIKSPPQVPNRKPDIIKKVKTFQNQSFIYRLTGDRNQLHIDPKIAKSQKFQKPIMHGMATYGSVARVFVQQILNNDPIRYKLYHARFVGHVYPGEILSLNLWKQGENLYIFQAETEQRKTKVLVGVFQLKPQPKL